MPKYINPRGLSDPWIEALKRQHEQYSIGDAFCSVSQLIQPPQLTVLNSRHSDDYVIDLSSDTALAALDGAAMHGVLSMIRMDRVFVEKFTIVEHKGIRIKLQPDLLDLRDLRHIILKDFKCTRAWSVRYGLKREWEMQCNFYRFLIGRYGMPAVKEGQRPLRPFPIHQMDIEYKLRDWDKLEAKINANNGYPPAPIDRVSVPMWNERTVEKMLDDRLARLKAAYDQEDAMLPECSDEDRWAGVSVYKVMKVGEDGAISDRALPNGGSFALSADAKIFASQKKYPTCIRFFPGESKRCDRYCPAAAVCRQRQRMLASRAETAQPDEMVTPEPVAQEEA